MENHGAVKSMTGWPKLPLPTNVNNGLSTAMFPVRPYHIPGRGSSDSIEMNFGLLRNLRIWIYGHGHDEKKHTLLSVENLQNDLRAAY